MGLMISMVVLCCIFAAMMSYALVKGHKQIKAELALKVRLFSLFVNDEYSHNESFGKAHCIVMDLADALQDDNMKSQFKKTHLVYEQAKRYKQVATTLPVSITKKQEPPLLQVVK